MWRIKLLVLFVFFGTMALIVKRSRLWQLPPILDFLLEKAIA
jgi:hypothetical protein